MKLTIQKGNPTKNGLYVCYVDHKHQNTYPEKELLMWFEGGWGFRGSDQKYRGKVYGWIGPIPTDTIENLNGSICVKYAISILPDGIHGCFQHGPFDTFQEAEDIIGKKGQYIFKLQLDQENELVGKWSDKKQEWLVRRNKEIKK